MKSPYQIAKELNVTPQAVYKRITDEFNNQFNNHIQRKSDGRYLLDPVAERAIKELFNQTIELVVQPTIEPVEQQLLNQLNSENAFLRERIERLEEELNIERAHGREIAERLAQIVENEQKLIGMDKMPLIEDKKRSWFGFMKKRNAKE